MDKKKKTDDGDNLTPLAFCTFDELVEEMATRGTFVCAVAMTDADGDTPFYYAKDTYGDVNICDLVADLTEFVVEYDGGAVSDEYDIDDDFIDDDEEDDDTESFKATDWESSSEEDDFEIE